MKRTLAILAVTFALPHPAKAEGPAFDSDIVLSCFLNTDYGDTKPDCIGQAANACFNMDENAGFGTVACWEAELATWDRFLNEEYDVLTEQYRTRSDQAATNASPTQLIDSLRDAQRNWISFRDSACGHDALLHQNSSLQGVVHAECLMKKTAQRVLELRDMIVRDS